MNLSPRSAGWRRSARSSPPFTVEKNPTAALRPGRWDVAAANRLFRRLAGRRDDMGNHLSDGEQQPLADQASLDRLIGLNLTAPTG